MKRTGFPILRRPPAALAADVSAESLDEYFGKEDEFPEPYEDPDPPILTEPLVPLPRRPPTVFRTPEPPSVAPPSLTPTLDESDFDSEGSGDEFEFPETPYEDPDPPILTEPLQPLPRPPPIVMHQTPRGTIGPGGLMSSNVGAPPPRLRPTFKPPPRTT